MTISFLQLCRLSAGFQSRQPGDMLATLGAFVSLGGPALRLLIWFLLCPIVFAFIDPARRQGSIDLGVGLRDNLWHCASLTARHAASGTLVACRQECLVGVAHRALQRAHHGPLWWDSTLKPYPSFRAVGRCPRGPTSAAPTARIPGTEPSFVDRSLDPRVSRRSNPPPRNGFPAP